MTVTADPLPERGAARLARAGTTGLWRDTLRNVLRQRAAIVGLTILVFLFLVAIFADFIAPFRPTQSMLDLPVPEKVNRQDPTSLQPCVHALGCPTTRPQHLFGLDGNLRDEFSRVVHGARVSLQIGFVTVGFAIVLGTIIGAVAGYAGGWTDNILMRLMDVVLSFPSLLLAIAIVTVLGSSLINAQLAIGIVAIPIYARVMRAAVLSTREADYIAASRALGESSYGLLLRRILPNSLTPLIVQGTLGIGGAILEVAALSFIGLGASREVAEWGGMIALDRNLINTAPHLILFPGIAITLAVLGFNLLGDGLRDALDPRLNR